MKKILIREKSFEFALRIIKLFKFLNEDKKEFIMSKQLLKSGTSIGANIREADNAESKQDFIHKMSIAQKEADETLYWLELLYQSGYLTQSQFDSIYVDNVEIIKILKSIIINTKSNLKINDTKR